MLKIFSQAKYIPPHTKCEPILYPFFGKPAEDPAGPKSGLFDRYIENADRIFTITSLADADIAIIPTNWEPILAQQQVEYSQRFLELVSQANIPSVSFFGGDCSHQELPIKSSITFRHSLYHSTQSADEFAFPAWSEDFVAKYLDRQLPIRHKSPRAVVGFCGYAAQKNPKTLLKDINYRLHKLTQKFVDSPAVPPANIGHVLRTRLLDLLVESKAIATNFKLRQKAIFFNETISYRQRMRREFVQNMVDSDYVLCCRGSGNYSFRFYEALSCGRIPIFVDTDCVLPYDFEIDWQKYCIWITEAEIPDIAEKIAEFHDRISDSEFVELQYECRRIWEKRIEPSGFFANLHRVIEHSLQLEHIS
jgi:hypothetical protein